MFGIIPLRQEGNQSTPEEDLVLLLLRPLWGDGGGGGDSFSLPPQSPDPPLLGQAGSPGAPLESGAAPDGEDGPPGPSLLGTYPPEAGHFGIASPPELSLLRHARPRDSPPPPGPDGSGCGSDYGENKERQTMLFSATIPEEIMSLCDMYMNKPISIEIKAQKLIGCWRRTEGSIP